MSNYGDDILRILSQVPEGLPVRKIVRHVYNAHHTLFAEVSLDDVRRDVTRYLASRARAQSSPIEHGERWGVYRLNPNSDVFRTLRLQFSDEAETPEPLHPLATMPSPSLFDE